VRQSFLKVRDRLRHAFGADEPPSRVAAAWALGIGIGLSPFIGLHTVLGLLLAVIFRLNKIDVLLGTMVSNPWVLTVYFPASVALGKWMLRINVPRIVIPELQQLLSIAAWNDQRSWLEPLLLSWTVGGTVCALVGAAVTYFLVRSAAVRHRRRLAAHRGRD
jgi:uncharacterized protein (DUF2062 family)